MLVLLLFCFAEGQKLRIYNGDRATEGEYPFIVSDPMMPDLIDFPFMFIFSNNTYLEIKLFTKLDI